MDPHLPGHGEHVLFVGRSHIYSITGFPTLGKSVATFSSSIKMDITITIELLRVVVRVNKNFVKVSNSELLVATVIMATTL